MANIVGQVNLNGCNYQVGYDLLGQNTAGNYSTVRFYGILNVTNNYIAWSRGTASVWGASAGLATRYNRGSYTVVTQDVNIGHDNQGNYSGTLSGSLNTTFVSGTASGGFSLPKINRIAITNSVSGGVLEENFKVNFTKYVDNYTYKLRISIPNVKELEKINYQNSGVNFKLTQETLDYLYTYTKNSNDVKLGFAVETWSGNSIISSGNEVIITGKIVNANPTFNDFTFEDTNSKTVALTGNNKSIISGYSNIKATISVDNKATAKKGATMVKYRLSVGDNSKDISYSSTAAVNGIVNKVTNSTINVYAIDSRNNSTLVSKQALKFYSYNPLEKGNISLERSDGGVGENVTLNYTGKIDLKNFGKVTNSIKTATYTLQRSDSSTITKGKTTIIPTVSSNGSFSFTGLIKGDTTAKGFDIGSSYIITVTVTDELSSITFTSNLSSGTPNIALSKNGVSVMGKYNDELGGYFQVAGMRMDNTLSENEIVIGKWIDGRKIYCKVVHGSGGNYGSTTNAISHGINNLDRVLLASFSAKDSTSNNNSQFVVARLSNDNANIGISSINNSYVNIFVNTAFGARVINIYVILIYIKDETDTINLEDEEIGEI